MKNIIKILLIILGVLLISCSKEEKISVIEEEAIEAQMIEAFKKGYDELNKGDVIYAAKNLMKLNFYIHNLIGLLKLRLWQHIHGIHRVIIMTLYLKSRDI